VQLVDGTLLQLDGVHRSDEVLHRLRDQHTLASIVCSIASASEASSTQRTNSHQDEHKSQLTFHHVQSGRGGACSQQSLICSWAIDAVLLDKLPARDESQKVSGHLTEKKKKHTRRQPHTLHW
jgi:hypothetical protein